MAVDNNGLMTFPNVTVVDAPVTDTAAPAIGTAGMRAQKDRDTGQLRAPTAAEVQELDVLTPAVPEAPVEIRGLPDGSTIAKLNQSYMSYSVVQKDASGELAEQCVTGESAADHALHVNSADEEVRHER
ncbi:MAG: post-PEP-CTERM-1 domain-containing protein [Burkholderiales bacterium]